MKYRPLEAFRQGERDYNPQETHDSFHWGDYIALSYVWGNPSGLKKETCLNGLPFKVTRNLYDALIRLRQSKGVCFARRKVWIDALCINQADIAERVREVQKMNRIYTCAIAVVAWVGQPSLEAAAFLPSFKNTFRRGMATPSRMSNLAEPWLVLTTRSFLELALQPYWERLWIIQELLLVTSVHFWSELQLIRKMRTAVSYDRIR
jgi:hypothetical protein